MNRIVRGLAALSCAFLLLVSVAACGSDDNEGGSGTTTSETETTETSETP